MTETLTSERGLPPLGGDPCASPAFALSMRDQLWFCAGEGRREERNSQLERVLFPVSSFL